MTHLAVEGRVAASTQNQALSALLFLYREVLAINLPWLDNVVRAKTPQRLPVVLTRQEVVSVLGGMSGVYGLMARLLYGKGMRLMECVRLRVKDVDFEQAEILIRDGKGAKDRVTMLPQSLAEALRAHLKIRQRLYEEDRAKGMASVHLPDALDRKYPNAAVDWAWKYIFNSGSYSIDPRSGAERHCQTGDAAYFPPFLRNAFAAVRLRHSYRAGTAWSCRCADHDDLHACPEPRRSGVVSLLDV